MSSNRKKMALVWAAAACMLISGCSLGGDKTAKGEESGGSGGSSVNAQTPEEIMSSYQGKLYIVSVGDSQVLITEDGREIMKGICFELVEDEANKGKYKYIAVMDSRDGQLTSRLFDGQLKEVLPAAPLRYLEIMEDAAYVTMYGEVEEDDSGYRYLNEEYNVIHLSDGKPVSEANLSKISDEKELYMWRTVANKYISFADKDYNVVGWIDFDGNVVDNIPAEDFYPLYDNRYVTPKSNKDYSAEGFYIGTKGSADDENRKQTLYDKDFKNPLGASYDRIDYCKGYVMANNYDGASVVYSLPELKEVYRVEDSAKEGIITYCNGKILIQRKTIDGNPYSGNSICQMKTVDGQPLGDTYNNIWLNAGNASGQLLSATSKDEKSFLLNDKGEVILELPDNSYASSLVGENVTVNTYSDSENGTESCELVNATTGETVMSMANKYDYLNPLYGNELEPTMWLGISEYYAMVDILDSDGKIIMSGLRDVQLLDDEKGYIQARKGFEEGVMTLDGKWIYKTSIFGNDDEGITDYMMMYGP